MVETSLASHIVTIPSLFLPPPPSTTTTTTTTTCRRRRRQAPRLTPTFGPTQGELVDTHTTQDRHVTGYNPPPSLPRPLPHLDCHYRHVTAPLDPQHHPNHRHVTRRQPPPTFLCHRQHPDRHVITGQRRRRRQPRRRPPVPRHR